MKTSCISHPEKERLVIIRKWQVEFCEGNICAASLLSYFEYWHNWKLNTDEYNKKYNNVAEMHGDSRFLSEDVLQYHSTQEMSDGILNLYGTRAIPEALKLLEAKGTISIHANPNPGYHYDKKKYFCFYPEVCNEWIKNHYKSRHSENTESMPQKGKLDVAKMPNADGESALLPCKNALPIAKINIKEINKSINAREIFSEPQEEERADIQPVVDALTAKGFPPERFQYPDVVAAVRRLLQVGATVDDFIKAYERIVKMKGGSSFSASYLTKAVQSDMQDQHKAIENSTHRHNVLQEAKPIFESNLSKGMQWLGDIVVSYEANKGEGPHGK